MSIASRTFLTKYELNMTKELMIFNFRCQNNQVAITVRYVTDAYCPKETAYGMQTQYDLRQRSY